MEDQNLPGFLSNTQLPTHPNARRSPQTTPLFGLIGYTSTSVEEGHLSPRDKGKEQLEDPTVDCPPYPHGGLRGFRIPALPYPG